MDITLESWVPSDSGRGAAPREEDEAGDVLQWLRGPSTETIVEDVTIGREIPVVTPPAELERLLRRAGWVRVNVQVILRDFEGVLMRSHTCFLQYTGVNLETNTGMSRLRGGTASFPDFWIKPQGTLRVIAVPEVGSPIPGGGSPGLLLEGSIAVPVISSSYLALYATQEYVKGQTRAGSQEAVAKAWQVQGNAKFSIKGVVEVGGGSSDTSTRTGTTSSDVLWDVRVGTPSLLITAAQR